MHIEPGHIQTLIASAPASISAFAQSEVAIFHQIICKSGYFFLIDEIVSKTHLLCQWAESTTTISTPTSTKPLTRSIVSAQTHNAAPTISLHNSSLEEFGNSLAFLKSLSVINHFNFHSLSTIGSFSILYFWKYFLASARLTW